MPSENVLLEKGLDRIRVPPLTVIDPDVLSSADVPMFRVAPVLIVVDSAGVRRMFDPRLSDPPLSTMRSTVYVPLLAFAVMVTEPADIERVPLVAGAVSVTPYVELRLNSAVCVLTVGGPAGDQLPATLNVPPAALVQVKICASAELPQNPAVISAATITRVLKRIASPFPCDSNGVSSQTPRSTSVQRNPPQYAEKVANSALR